MGKTASTLAAITPDNYPTLVVAPKRVAEQVWPEELPRWRPDLTYTVVAGPPQQRAARLAAPSPDVTLIGRDNLADVPLGRYKTIVLDELSGFKTRASKRWKLARKLTKDATYVWGLTGTPSPNGLMDLWAQVYLLDNGKRLGTAVTQFRNRYFSPGQQLASGVIIEWILKPEADAAIHRAIDDICLSMENRIALPPRTDNRIRVKLPAASKRQYQEMLDTMVLDLELLGGTVHTAANAAILSNKLSQVAAGFIYDDLDPSRYETLNQSKLGALREVVEAATGPVLVAYRYRPELEAIRKEFGDRVYTADTPNLQQRWNRGELPIVASHPASIGHGLNLQYGGHTIVWTSLTWSLEEWQQFNKRLLRPGQQHPVVIHTLEAIGTVDSGIYNRLQGKASVQDALLAHLRERTAA